MGCILFTTVILISIVNFNYTIGIEKISTSLAEVIERSTTQEPILCPDINCDSAECHHLERSGLCEDVVKGDIEITRENCGCCFLCADDVGPEKQRVIRYLKDVNDKPPYFINHPLPMQAVVPLSAPPGTPVFKLQARDPDTDHDIHYFLVRDSTGGRFEVDERSGEVRTLGSDPFMLDKEYVLYVKAEDHNGMTEDRQHQSTGEERLSIMGGKRPPQFYMQKYEATIPENQRKDSDIIEVKAKSFADREIRYRLRAMGRGAGTFNIGPTTGVVKLAKDLDYEDPKQFKSHYLMLTAEEAGGFKTNIELIIKVTDVNDTAPRFELPETQVDENVAVGTPIFQATNCSRNVICNKNNNPPYFVKALYEVEVEENEDIGYTVITVTAKDKDEPSRLRYEITHGNVGGAFGVEEETGAIYVAGPLDYESRKAYTLRLIASDNLNENYTTVAIHIKDINDNPPVFDRPLFESQKSEEDDRFLPKRFLQVAATDGDFDRKPDIVYSLSGQGVDDQNPANSNFAINATSGEMYIMRPLDRDLPHGKAEWRFKVFATDEGGKGLVGYADVLFKLVDINDNAPIFLDSNYIGHVPENGTAGTPVMTMTATDYDDPNEGTNARIRYSIEQNWVNGKDELVFSIDEDTGVISTAVCCLDRETNPEYTIKVLALDGGGLKSTATATIKVDDINDMPPRFTEFIWRVEVQETEGDNIPDTPVLVVSVNDGDLLETNNFSYKVNDAAFGADKFTMITNSDGTGSLKIAKPLDFEDLEQRRGFNFRIQVSDNGGESPDPYHIDYATVIVRLIDINDNDPEFENANIEVTVKENAEIGTGLAIFRATDADRDGKSLVSYNIDRSSDKKRQFRIDRNGAIIIQRTLDREETPRHQVKVLAIDDGTPPRTAIATLTVVVRDINDNAPRFLRDYRPVILEGSHPKKVVEVLAVDDDDYSKGNGPPFTFRMDPNAPDIIKQCFSVHHDSTDCYGMEGMAIIRSKKLFDREQQKEYLIPIVINDSGTPSMTSTSTLTVIIGDVNDNIMHPGSKSIFVYYFKGEYRPTPIGRVHVKDLDDWDLPDKFFYWENHTAHPNFQVYEDTGLIVMKKGTNEGTYFLRFVVLDRIHTQGVTANVSVTVKNIPEEAIFNSGSIRISGISAEDFVRIWDWKGNREVTSKYEKFRDMIANLLTTRKENVDVFSVMIKQERPPITDVRFSVHKSSYLKESLLNGIVAVNKEMIEHAVGINITMIGIDECLIENMNCESSCTNVLVVDKQPVMVDANLTSFVGVNTRVQPKCVCGARDFSQIETCRKRPSTCHNGGTCFQFSGGVSCKCPDGYEGPHCQMTTRFFDGRGWAWFPSLKQCENSHLSLEFMTKFPDGLLLYNGPMSEPGVGRISAQDFISLELQRGKPRLLIDFGSGTAEVVVDIDESLSDGEWHQVDIFWTKESVRLVIDNCRRAKIEDSDPPQMNRFRCEAKKNIPPFNEFLNVNTPLQLGGVYHQFLMGYRWQHHPSREGFQGCIKNIIHNSEVYDLAKPGNSSGSSPGCKLAEDACQRHNDNNFCGHGLCTGTYNSAKCICKPGYFGKRCDKETKSKMFKLNSYIKYRLSFEPDPYKTDIQLQFRTRQKNGELFRATSKSGKEYCILEIRDEKLRLRLNLNHLRSSDEHELWLPNVQVSDGQWHTVRVLRYGSTASISLDGGGGRRYNEMLDYKGQHQHMTIETVTVGGDVLYANDSVTLVNNDFHEGCMKDIRLNEHYLSMENETEDAVVLKSRNVIEKCPSNNPCKEIICPKPFICFDLWMLPECRCPERPYHYRRWQELHRH